MQGKCVRLHCSAILECSAIQASKYQGSRLPILEKLQKKTRIAESNSGDFYRYVFGAGSGTRTHTLLRAADFESAASTDSAIPARDGHYA